MGNTDKGSDSSPSQGLDPGLKSRGGWEHLISEYLSDLPRQLNSIRTILEIPDYAKIKKQAHRIKGTSGTYGLDTISQDAAQLEQSAEAHNRENVTLALSRIIKSVKTQSDRQNPQSTSPAKPPSPAANRERTARERAPNG